MYLNEEDGLKRNVLLSRMKGLFKIHYIERMFGCLFLIVFLSFLHGKNPDVFSYSAAYMLPRLTCNEINQIDEYINKR